MVLRIEAGAQRDAALGDGARADRLPGLEVGLDDLAEDVPGALIQLGERRGAGRGKQARHGQNMDALLRLG
jgi:hypothetical protein